MRASWAGSGLGVSINLSGWAGQGGGVPWAACTSSGISDRSRSARAHPVQGGFEHGFDLIRVVQGRGIVGDASHHGDDVDLLHAALAQWSAGEAVGAFYSARDDEEGDGVDPGPADG